MRPEAPEAHYLLVGRLSSLVVVAVGVLFALGLESVISGLEWIWRLMAFLGIAFWAALCWRRANRYGAWASVTVTALIAIGTSFLGWSFPAQVALYLPAGFAVMVVVSLATRPEPEGRLNAFYSLLNTPVGEEDRLVAAGIEIIHESDTAQADRSQSAGGDGLAPTPPDVESALTPTAPASGVARTVPLLDDAPAARRGASLILVNLLNLSRGFTLARYRDDLGGFAVAWAIVAGLLVLTWGLAWLAG